MGTELLSPKKSGSNGKGENQQHDKPRNKRKKSIALVVALIEGFALILWQVSDQHSGSAAKIIHWVSECGFTIGIAYLAQKLLSKKRGWAPWVLCAALCFLFFPNTKEGKSTPHFIYSFLTADDFRNRIPLTNDFLFQPIDGKSHEIWGCLNLPVSQNLKLYKLRIFMQPSDFAEAATFTISTPKFWNCTFDPQWQPVSNENILVSSDAKETVEKPTESFTYQFPMGKYPNDISELPAVYIPTGTNGLRNGVVSIWGQARGWPVSETLTVRIYFLPEMHDTNNPSTVFAPSVEKIIPGTNGVLAIPSRYVHPKTN